MDATKQTLTVEALPTLGFDSTSRIFDSADNVVGVIRLQINPPQGLAKAWVFDAQGNLLHQDALEFGTWGLENSRFFALKLVAAAFPGVDVVIGPRRF